MLKRHYVKQDPRSLIWLIGVFVNNFRRKQNNFFLLALVYNWLLINFKNYERRDYEKQLFSISIVETIKLWNMFLGIFHN